VSDGDDREGVESEAGEKVMVDVDERGGTVQLWLGTPVSQRVSHGRSPIRMWLRCLPVAFSPLFVRLSASDWADGINPESDSDGKWLQ